MEICFILVEPATPENVGAAARALKTMGFAGL
jgi:tRNA/rRNA methyltransferase